MVLPSAQQGPTAGIAVICHTYDGAPVPVGGPYLVGRPVPVGGPVVLQLLIIAVTCAWGPEIVMVLSSAQQGVTAGVVLMLTLAIVDCRDLCDEGR